MQSEDYGLLIGWLKDPLRKPAVLAFTSGALRDAATAVEESGVLARITELLGALSDALLPLAVLKCADDAMPFKEIAPETMALVYRGHTVALNALSPNSTGGE